MYISDKDRKEQKKTAQERLNFLMANGLDTAMPKEFKSTGRVYINEIYNNKIPRTYLLIDSDNVKDIMLDTRLDLDNDGYLVYLITREKSDIEPKRDILNYFIVDKPVYKFSWNAQDSQFRKGYAQVYSQDIFTGKGDFTYADYKIRYSQIIIVPSDDEYD